MIKVSDLSIPTLDDVNAFNKKILLRIDINSPVDKKTGKLLDDSRIKAHAYTVKNLLERDNAIVILSHQGRPGDDDFISLQQHAELLSKYIGTNVEFIEDIIGPYAIEKVKKIEKRQIYLLENVRLVSEELIEAPPAQQAKTFLVRKLSPLFDIYVNDAFAAAHRSQPSLVGFPIVLPSAAGKVMEKEVSALAKIFNPEDSPKIFVLGGGKVSDTLKIIEHLAKNRVADRILTGGLVAELFAAAKGINLGKANMQVLESKGLLSLIPRARKLLLSGAPIEIPVDFVTEKQNGETSEEPANNINGTIKDIGSTTIEIYSSFIKEAKVITMRGPMGIIEDERFRNGTKSLLKSAFESPGFVIIGGGHMISMVEKGIEINENKVHISTGGGALLLFLAGDKLPALEALHLSWVSKGGKS
jgi:phosphoglycerate kinase